MAVEFAASVAIFTLTSPQSGDAGEGGLLWEALHASLQTGRRHSGGQLDWKPGATRRGTDDHFLRGILLMAFGVPFRGLPPRKADSL